MDVEAFEKFMKELPDTKFNSSISKGALKLTDEQIDTVHFVFWMCYMAEIDLKTVVTEAWSNSSKLFPSEVAELAKMRLNEMILGKKNINFEDEISSLSDDLKTRIRESVNQNYLKKRDIDVENLDYFMDKIRVYEAMFGKNDRCKILYKINDMRNAISHNRIDSLLYNNENLSLRGTKEKLIMDYVRSAFNSEFEDTDFFKSLSEEDKELIAASLDKISV